MNQEIYLSRDERLLLIAKLDDAMRGLQHASEQAQEAFAAFLGINRTDGRCLDIIQRHRRITAGRLAEESGLTTGAVTAVIDRLETAGYVLRVRDNRDRRRIHVEPATEIDQLAEQVYGPLTEARAAQLEQLPDAHLLAIYEFIDAGCRATLGHAALLKSYRPARRVPLRYRLEQAKQLKDQAKTLGKQMKADLKDQASRLRELRDEVLGRGPR